MNGPKDFLGQDVAVGDVVAYSVTSGRSAQIAIGRVMSIEWVKPGEAALEYVKQLRMYADRWQTELASGKVLYSQVEDWARDSVAPAGTITKAKVQPIVQSRWNQYWSKDGRTVTLTAGARGILKITDLPVDFPEETQQPDQ